LGATGSCHVQGYDDRVTKPPSQHASRLVGVGLAACLLLAACDLGRPSSNPAITTPASAAPSTAASEGPTAGIGAGQTDTDWGRIWDGLPSVFPIYPGATPADDAPAEVASATFALNGAETRTVVLWMQTELERATYATEALNGPLEDGSVVLESIGTGDCRIQVTVAPLGGLTTVTVRYGAACPAP
jgi:hypothetical protein